MAHCLLEVYPQRVVGVEQRYTLDLSVRRRDKRSRKEQGYLLSADWTKKEKPGSRETKRQRIFS